MKTPKLWCVTRQKRWDDGKNIVEINYGGIDYANPDAYSARYQGEFEEFTNPIEATETAIKIAQQWQKDNPNKEIFIASGFTMGMTMNFEEMTLNEETFQSLREEAQEEYNSLPKCNRCGDILPEKTYTLPDYDFDEEFCSENCANMAYDYYTTEEQELLLTQNEEDDWD